MLVHLGKSRPRVGRLHGWGETGPRQSNARPFGRMKVLIPNGQWRLVRAPWAQHVARHPVDRLADHDVEPAAGPLGLGQQVGGSVARQLQFGRDPFVLAGGGYRQAPGARADIAARAARAVRCHMFAGFRRFSAKYGIPVESCRPMATIERAIEVPAS